MRINRLERENKDKSSKIEMVAVTTRDDETRLIFETTTGNDVNIGQVHVLAPLPWGEYPSDEILECEMVDYIIDQMHYAEVLENKIEDYLNDFGLRYYVIAPNPNNPLESWWENGGQVLWNDLTKHVYVHGSVQKVIVSATQKQEIVKRAEKITGWGVGPELNEYQLSIQLVNGEKEQQR